MKYKGSDMQNTDKGNKGGFVAGTFVHTDKGLIPIQNLQVGDLILTSRKKGVTEFRPVLTTFSYHNQEVYELILELYDESQESTITNRKTLIDIFYCGNETKIFNDFENRWVNTFNAFDCCGFFNIRPKYPHVNKSQVLAINLLSIWQKFGVGFGDEMFPCMTFSQFESNNFNTLVIDGENYGKYDEEFLLDSHFRNLETQEDKNTIVEFINRTEKLQGSVYQTLYQLEVEKTHTYFIGENGLWVHDVTEPVS